MLSIQTNNNYDLHLFTLSSLTTMTTVLDEKTNCLLSKPFGTEKPQRIFLFIFQRILPDSGILSSLPFTLAFTSPVEV